ncbi:MAG: META domain-containing protein [Acidimicrobiia bacterium]|nr:META domain-containing protein [Acidimicrobiia bacterium]
MKTHSTPTKHRRRRSGLPAVLIMVLAATAACGEGGESTGNPLEGSKWEMISVREGETLMPADPANIVTAVFSGGTARGYEGCNFYQLRYAVDGDSISLDEPAITGQACEPIDRERQGDVFIQAMQAARRFVLAADNLELTDAAGAAQVVFRPATDLPLTWVAWQLVWYGGGTSPLAGTQISLAFRDDGTLTGNAGCNSYSADYEITGDQLVIGPIAHTEMACMDPDGAMTQETDYLSTLDRVAAFTTTLTGLELLDADANPIAEYRFGGRIRDDLSGATDGDQEEAAFIDLTRNAAIRLAVDQGRLWRISRQDDELFAHDAQLLVGRVTFEIDNGRVTSASIERDTPPDPGNDLVEDPARANLIAAAVKRLLTVDNSFGGDDVFDDIRVATVIGGDPDQPLQFLDREMIAAAVSGLGIAHWVDDADAEIEAILDESPAGVAVVSVEGVLILDDRAQIEMRLWCGSLCGVFLTYEAEPQDGGWNIVGTTGPTAMS